MRSTPDRDVGLRRQRRDSEKGVSGGQKDRRPGYRRLRYRSARGRTRRQSRIVSRIRHVFAGRENWKRAAAALSSLAHAGSALDLPQSRAWRTTEVATKN